MAKGIKIEGFAIVQSVGATDCGGPNEVPVIRLRMVGEFTGVTYRWISEKIDCLELKSGQQIHIRAFVRPNGISLYRVTATV